MATEAGEIAGTQGQGLQPRLVRRAVAEQRAEAADLHGGHHERDGDSSLRRVLPAHPGRRRKGGEQGKDLLRKRLAG